MHGTLQVTAAEPSLPELTVQHEDASLIACRPHACYAKRQPVLTYKHERVPLWWQYLVAVREASHVPESRRWRQQVQVLPPGAANELAAPSVITLQTAKIVADAICERMPLSVRVVGEQGQRGWPRKDIVVCSVRQCDWLASCSMVAC